MANSLNFKTLKKRYLTVTFDDEKATTIMVGTPTKATMDNLIALQSILDSIEDESSVEATDTLYEACAEVMSRNKTGVKITKEYLADIFDFEDIVIFFNAYMNFIGEITSSKN